jgi:predicted transcriptional regulator with HTH domain
MPYAVTVLATHLPVQKGGIYAAACLPLGFFLPTSEMVRPVEATLDGVRVWRGLGERTRGKRLLELLGLVGVLEDEGVDVPRAADLELDVVDLLVLLDARGCHTLASVQFISA